MKASVNHTTIGYEEFGSGLAMVLLHGLGGDRRMWRHHGETLAAAGYRVIVPDLRGFGESRLREPAVDLQEMAEDVVGLLDYLGIGRAVVCGISLGGQVLLELMVRHRQRVVGACFIATPGLCDDPAEGRNWQTLGALVADLQGERLADGLLPWLLRPEFLETHGEEAEMLRQWLIEQPSGTTAAAVAALAQRPDHARHFGSFGQPILVVGAEGDRLVPPGHSRAMAAAFARSRHYIFPSAGHLLNLERPAALNDCLLDFLEILTKRAAHLSDVA